MLIEIEDQTERIERLTAQAENMVAVYQLAPARGSGGNDKLANYIIQKDRVTAALLDNLSKTAAEAAEIESAIGELSDTRERQVISLRYVDGLVWYHIANRLNYSVDHVYTIHGRALKNLLKITQDNSSSQ
jgi:DNA-directed RNA polymerase specialized sigma subunit